MRIIIVCSGNTCRSPLAEVMLREKLVRDGVTNVDVSSAGVAAWAGTPASEGSYLVALERGLDLSAHRARVLTEAMVERADLILTMSEAHAQRVDLLGGIRKTSTLGAYAGNPRGIRDVPDPMGSDVAMYRSTADILDEMVEAAVIRIAREKDG